LHLHCYLPNRNEKQRIMALTGQQSPDPEAALGPLQSAACSGKSKGVGD
jgi:hypothetical protein